jgi:hypothetical protein
MPGRMKTSSTASRMTAAPMTSTLASVRSRRRRPAGAVTAGAVTAGAVTAAALPAAGAKAAFLAATGEAAEALPTATLRAAAVPRAAAPAAGLGIDGPSGANGGRCLVAVPAALAKQPRQVLRELLQHSEQTNCRHSWQNLKLWTNDW